MEAASSADTVQYVSQAEYARQRNCTAQHISNLIRAGKIRTYGDKKRIDPIEANATLDALRDDSREGVRQSNAARYGKPYAPPIASPQSRSSITLTPEQHAALGDVGKKNEIPDFAKSKAEREFLAVQRERIELARELNQVVERELAIRIASDVGREWLSKLNQVQMELPGVLASLVARAMPGAHPDQMFQIEQEARIAIAKSHRSAVESVTSVLDSMAKSLEAPTN